MGLIPRLQDPEKEWHHQYSCLENRLKLQSMGQQLDLT